jgi:UDP-N-acetylglucosamine acyltransferase
MSARIHPTAIVDPTAKLADGVSIGAYTVIETDVTIGADCEVGPFCRFASGTSVGDRNRFESHCSVGAPPQDLKYRGEPTRLEIGDENWFREFVTLHRGTPGGGGITRIGDKSLFMAYAHVAHDCQIGSQTIFANNATLAGHVEVGDFATVGALSAVHQFSRVGQHAFLGGFTGANKDCLPFMSTVGNRPPKCYGPNSIGLERKGFSEERRMALRRLWRHLHNPKLNTTQALDRIRDELGGQPDVEIVLEFMATSKRGVILG